MSAFEQMSDEEIIAAYRRGEESAIDSICQKYKPLVLKRAKAMFLAGGETDDLIQEGMLGLFKAIRDFEPERGIPFSSFAQLCVSRQIQKAVETSNRKKNQPLNAYISISDPGETGDGLTEELLRADHAVNPEQMMIDTESMEQTKKKVMGSLSSLEAQVLKLHLQGYDYHAIARKLNRSEKAIDNALQRIRQKARQIL